MPAALNERTAPVAYGALMALWIGFFANSHREPPPLVVLLLFALPLVFHVGLGWLVGRWWALALAGLPVAASVAAAGFRSDVTVFVAMLMVFPGVPLIAAGVFARVWHEERENPVDEIWML